MGYRGNPTGEIRNCGEDGCVCDKTEDDYQICFGDDLVLAEDRTAGGSCQGGTLDGNDNTTQETCEEGGGVYEYYTCGYVQWWLVNDSDMHYMERIELIENLWRPMCCDDSFAAEVVVAEDKKPVEKDTTTRNNKLICRPLPAALPFRW